MLNPDPIRPHSSGASSDREGSQAHAGEQGFLLLGLIVAIFLILLALSVAAPRVAHELRREREVEAVHRGNEYVRAIQVYYRKLGHYPTSIEQLEKTSNIRYLRKRYVDPMTGKDDWRLIHLGEAKTTVKGFFGQPLAGIASSGLGSAAGMASPGMPGSPAGGTGSTFGTPASGLSTGGLGTSGSGTSGLSGTPGSSSSSTGSFGSSSGQSGSGLSGEGGPIVGVGLAQTGNSIITLNEQTTYPTWEFLYDPRIEQLKAKSSLFGGGMTSTSASTFGSGSNSNSGFGGQSTGNSPATGTQPSNSGFGSGTFGSGSGSSPNPTPTTNNPQ
jgi:type II secretory pathway pseudopilin PulG